MPGHCPSSRFGKSLVSAGGSWYGLTVMARSYGSKRQSEHAFVMSRDPLKIRGVFWLEQLAMVPRVFDGRQCPEVAFGIQYNPVPIRSVREECWYVLPARFIHRIPLFHKMR